MSATDEPLVEVPLEEDEPRAASKEEEEEEEASVVFAPKPVTPRLVVATAAAASSLSSSSSAAAAADLFEEWTEATAAPQQQPSGGSEELFEWAEEEASVQQKRLPLRQRIAANFAACFPPPPAAAAPPKPATALLNAEQMAALQLLAPPIHGGDDDDDDDSAQSLLVEHAFQEVVAELVGHSSSTLVALSAAEQQRVVSARADAIEALFVAQLEHVAALEEIWRAHGEPLLAQAVAAEDAQRSKKKLWWEEDEIERATTAEERPRLRLTVQEWETDLGLAAARDALKAAQGWLGSLSETISSAGRGHAQLTLAAAALHGAPLRTFGALCSRFRSTVDHYSRLLNSPDFAAFVLAAQHAGTMSLPTLLRAAVESLPAYDALLGAIAAATWETHPDHEDLPEAISVAVVPGLRRVRETIAAQDSRSDSGGTSASEVSVACGGDGGGSSRSAERPQVAAASPRSNPEPRKQRRQELSPEDLSTMSDDELRQELRRLSHELNECDSRLRTVLEERERLRTEKELYGLQVQQLVAVIRHNDARSSSAAGSGRSLWSSALSSIPGAILGLFSSSSSSSTSGESNSTSSLSEVPK